MSNTIAIHRDPLPTHPWRPFFLTAIAIGVLAGAAWGTLLLVRIAGTGSFTGVGIHEINAHGHAQVAGWVGLFMMGFAYQAFPRMWHARLPLPSLAVGIWLAMLATIVVRAIAMSVADAPWAAPAHASAAIVQVLAVGTFVAQLVVVCRRGGQPITASTAFMLTALGCMLAQSIYDGWHHAALLAAADRGALLEQLATHQAPLRNIQIHGTALLMITGVGLRIFPAMFNLAPVPTRRAWTVLILFIAALSLELWLFLSFRMTDQRGFAGAMIVPWIMLLGGAWLLVSVWRPWRPWPCRDLDGVPDRSAKFVRAALLWLLVALGLLLLTPAYLILWGSSGGGGFSHAWHGAARHAITVGFVSMTIVGVASKIVPSLSGVAARHLTPLWGPFVLINVGCAARVTLQIASDWHPAPFALIAISGAMELAALAWWGGHMVTVIFRGILRRESTGLEPDLEPGLKPGSRVRSAPQVAAPDTPCCGACADSAHRQGHTRVPSTAAASSASS
jgi:hypothetical protein